MTFNLVPLVYAADSYLGTQAWENAGCAKDGVVTIKGIECLIQNFLSPLPTLIALSAVGMIIFAGIKIVNAGADPKAYAAGWNTFTYALIGLILLSVVWLAIVLIKTYTGAPDIMNFGLPN